MTNTNIIEYIAQYVRRKEGEIIMVAANRIVLKATEEEAYSPTTSVFISRPGMHHFEMHMANGIKSVSNEMVFYPEL